MNHTIVFDSQCQSLKSFTLLTKISSLAQIFFVKTCNLVNNSSIIVFDFLAQKLNRYLTIFSTLNYPECLSKFKIIFAESKLCV